MIHHVFACKTNIGDWLSARGIQRLLAPLPVTEHLCDEPFVPATLAALARLESHDLVVIGGGGLFMDYFAPFWEGFAALAGRVPFCVWGAGACDLKSHESRVRQATLQRVLRHSRLTVVRDAPTAAYLLPVASNIVHCPSFNALAAPPQPGHGVLHAVHYGDVGAAVYEQMHALCEDYAARTGRAYHQIDNNLPQATEEALEAALARYRAADLVVSSRLHGCIIGVALGRKVIGVAADRKIEAFMATAGLGEWVCDAGDLSPLPGMLTQIDRQPPAEAFAAATRAANLDIAARVKALALAVTSGEE